MNNVVALKSRTTVRTDGDYGVAQDRVQGLMVRVKGPLSYYLYRFRLHGARQRISIGPVTDWTLEQAVAEAQKYAAWVSDGKDPKVERTVQRDLKVNGVFTFQRAAEEWMERKFPALKSDKEKEVTASRLRRLYPVLGKLPVAAITPDDITKAIQPMWVEANISAQRNLRNVKDIFNAAIARGQRTGANPADIKVLKHLLTAVPKRGQKHYASLPWEDLPTFWKELADESCDSAGALRLALLTAQRTGQVIDSTVSQFQPDDQLWVFEGDDTEKMKTDVELHRVAMGPLACKLVRERAEALEGTDRLQPTERKLYDLSEDAMLALLRRMGYSGAGVKKGRITVHGFRATFRTWFEDNWHKLDIWNNAKDMKPHLVAEAQLSHTSGKTKIDAAYQRSDKLAKRLEVMAKFEEFVTGGVRQ